MLEYFYTIIENPTVEQECCSTEILFLKMFFSPPGGQKGSHGVGQGVQGFGQNSGEVPVLLDIQ